MYGQQIKSLKQAKGLKNVSKPLWKASKIKRLSETPDRCLTV